MKYPGLLILLAALALQPTTTGAVGAQPEQLDPELRAALLEAVRDADSFEDRFDAEVWLTAMSSRLQPFVDDHGLRLDLLREIHREATRAELQPDIVLAVIEVESRFDRFALSTAGAQGLMQVMPFWKRELGREDDNLMDITTNLRYGCTILRYYLGITDGNMRLALQRYNGSVGHNWYPELVLNAWERWR